MGRQESHPFTVLKCEQMVVLGCAELKECCENNMYSKWDAS